MGQLLPTETTFLRDVAEHEMTVLRDEGLYRHLRFRRGNSWNMGFDVTTWPGMLCFSGDMGCYVFSRIPDMLEFFRGPQEESLYVNLGYWAEKVQASDRCCGIEEYSPERFKAAVERWLDDVDASYDLRMAVADDVLSRADDGAHEAVRSAMEFEHEGFTFDCFYEVDIRDYTYRFVWCCYALAWAVRRYDAAKIESAREAC